MVLTIENKNADISRIALYWDERIEQWQLLSVGDSQADIDDRVRYWRGKGTQNVRVFDVLASFAEGDGDLKISPGNIVLNDDERIIPGNIKIDGVGDSDSSQQNKPLTE